MSHFTVHDETTAPPDAAGVVGQTMQTFGCVPHLIGVLAEAPAAAEAYLELTRLFRGSSLTPAERHVVWFTLNAFHGCTYCMAAHTMAAKNEGVADDVIETARAVGIYEDDRLEALRQFTLAVVEQRGRVGDDVLDRFFAADFTRRQALEVVLAVANKTLSNYANHLAKTPLDPMFEPFAWTLPAAAQGASR